MRDTYLKAATELYGELQLARGKMDSMCEIAEGLAKYMPGDENHASNRVRILASDMARALDVLLLQAMNHTTYLEVFWPKDAGIDID